MTRKRMSETQRAIRDELRKILRYVRKHPGSTCRNFVPVGLQGPRRIARLRTINNRIRDLVKRGMIERVAGTKGIMHLYAIDARTPDAECSECGARYWSGTGHPTRAVCAQCR